MMMGVVGAVGLHVPSWQTTFSATLSSNVSGWNGFNMRQKIAAAGLSVNGGTQIRITLESSSAAGFTIDGCYIGHAAAAGDPYDFDGGQVQVLFNSGSASLVLGAASTQVSDAVNFVLDNSKNLLIAVHFSASSAVRAASPANTTNYNKSAANETSTSDVTGYATSGTTLQLVNKVEVFV